jgi:hypothetical protein
VNWEQSTSLRSPSSFRISRDAGRHVTAATRIRVNGTDEVDAFKGDSRDGSARPLLSPVVTYDGDLHHRRGQVTSHSRTELMNVARRREAPPRDTPFLLQLLPADGHQDDGQQDGPPRSARVLGTQLSSGVPTARRRSSDMASMHQARNPAYGALSNSLFY